MTRLLCVLACVALVAAPVAAADLPEIKLTVTERAGVARSGNHVTGGLPLPLGAVKDVGTLSLIRRSGTGDQPVPAQFVVRQKWLHDDSVRWATVHFVASAAGGGKTEYVVRVAKAEPFAYPIKAQAAGDRVTVDTGAIRFVVVRNNFNVIDQASFDPTGQGKYAAAVLAPGKARLKCNVQVGKYKVEKKKAMLDVVGDPADVVAKADKLELEENTPGRAVVKVTGTFMDGITPTLDFVCRIYALSGSATVRVAFTVVNRSAKEWRDFVGVNELALELPVSLGDALQYTISNSDGADASGPLAAGESAGIIQPYSEDYTLTGAAKGAGHAKSLLTRRLGWAALTGKDVAAVVGIRNFWQLHPKGLEVRGDGTLSLQIVPKQDKKVEVPSGVVSQADTQAPFFAGGARTHELLIGFCPAGQQVAAVAMGVVDPLLAAAETAWYCQGSKAEGPLFDCNPENFKPEYREAIAAFDKHASDSLGECAGKTRRAGSRGTEEYGFFNYGAGTEAKGDEYITPNDWLNTRWDGNYYDFPRATLVHFWRTGDLNAWDIAEAAALHLADVDIAHIYPGNSKLNGIERTCPNRGHFRQWWPGEPFGVSGNMDSTKSQSLYDLYHMTGDAWYLDCGLLVSNYCMNHTGGALRAIGNRAKGLINAYEQTGDKKYLAEASDWLNKQLVPRSPLQAWDQNWMYGLAGEGLFDLFRLTGEDKWAKTAVNCCDSLVNKFWKPGKATAPLAGFTLNCFGYAYELTGNEDYLKRGLETLAVANGEYAGSTKTFAQQFRIAPYFFVYLTKDYKLPQPVVKK